MAGSSDLEFLPILIIKFANLAYISTVF